MSDISLFTSPEWPYLVLPIVLGLAVSLLWVVPTVIWQWVGEGKGAASVRRLGWLSMPWIVLYPVGLFTGAIPLAAATPIATTICAIVGVVLLKSRANAVAVGLTNVVISLCCGAAQVLFSGG